jgi:hypothetical protein
MCATRKDDWPEELLRIIAGWAGGAKAARGLKGAHQRLGGNERSKEKLANRHTALLRTAGITRFTDGLQPRKRHEADQNALSTADSIIYSGLFRDLGASSE